jgi:hypothetical protein
MRRLLIPATLLIALLATALPAHGATVRVQRFSGFQDVRVAGAQQTAYRLRLAYTVPGTWRVRGRATGLTRTFGPIGSCRFTVRVTARAVTDAPEAASARVARPVGAQAVSGLLVRPAPSIRTQPAGGQVWLEVRFSATPDPRTECHAGGPRTVGAQTGDALATAVVGGFQI